MTYDCDVVDGRGVVQQQGGTVDVVALRRHVQRTEPVLRLRRQLGGVVDQHLHDGTVTTTTGAVQRRQTVLTSTTTTIHTASYLHTSHVFAYSVRFVNEKLSRC